jgi:hypothetical protein
MKKEKGQGFPEYAIVIILMVLVVVFVIYGIVYRLIPWIKNDLIPWGAGIVAGVQAGDPSSIFVLILFVVFALWFIMRTRR